MLGAGTRGIFGWALQRLRLSNGTWIRIKGLPCPLIITLPPKREFQMTKDVQFITGKGRGTTTVQAQRPRKATLCWFHPFRLNVQYRHSGRGLRHGCHRQTHKRYYPFWLWSALPRATCRRLTNSHAGVSSSSTANGLVGLSGQIVNFPIFKWSEKKNLKKKGLGCM